MSACGGGGGGGSNRGGGHNPGVGSDEGGAQPPDITYSGVSAQAVLNQSNTPRIAGELLYELGITDVQRPLPMGYTGTHSLREFMTKYGAPAVMKRSLIPPPILSTYTCAQGGSVVTVDTRDDRHTGTVTTTYSSCRVENVRVDGVYIVKIDAYDLARDCATDVTWTFQHYSYNDDSGNSIDTAGSIHYVSSSSSSLTATYNLTRLLKPEGVTHRFDGVSLVWSLSASSSDVLNLGISGRFYRSLDGYVDLETPVPLTTTDNGLPLGETLRLKGAGSTADMRYDSADLLTLELDENHDGVIDRRLQAYSSNMASSSTFAPIADAGEDQTIVHGATVTLHGSGSDWEHSPLTYQWLLVSAPEVTTFLAVDTAEITYAPPRPGTYVFQLAANDGTFKGLDRVTVTVTPSPFPVANAGPDVRGVAGVPITLDGSASTNVEGLPLNCVWTRVYAYPQDLGLPETLSGCIVTASAQRPGVAHYQLQVSDAARSGQDLVSVSVEPFAQFASSLSYINVNARTTPGGLTQTIGLSFSSAYTGPSVPISVTSDAPWLKVVSAPAQSGPDESVVIRVDADLLPSMANGTHPATLTITPQGLTASTVQKFLSLYMPKIEHISPYVVYAGESSTIVLRGTALELTNGILVIDGMEVSGLTDATSVRAKITLPPLATGEYRMRIKSQLGIDQPMGRLVVRPAPTYPDGSLDISGRVESLAYDAERDAFYVVTWDLDSNHVNELYRLHYSDGGWHKDSISVTAPQAVSLDTDGRKLLVTTGNCGVMELDAATLALLQTTTKSPCASEVFGMLMGLNDGRVLVGDTNQSPTVWMYPDFLQKSLPAPHAPTALLNIQRDRILIAGLPTISGPRELYFHKADNGDWQNIAVHDPDTYFLPGLLAMDADGKHIMHGADMYEDAQYLRSLAGVTYPHVSPALTQAGDRVVILDPDTNVLSLYDVSVGSMFAKISDIATLDDVGPASRLMLLPNDRVAFVFATAATGGGASAFRMYIRNLQ